jgi:solute carrier family 13 (sodium-dependent dicarboxylate transporter), member 2/3/5
MSTTVPAAELPRDKVPDKKPVADITPFDPLDMRNYELEKLQEIKAGPIMAKARLIGVPLAIVAFLFFHFQWSGPIEIFETQTKVKAVSHLYSATGVFAFSLILWMTESIPSYLTSFIIIVAVILLDIMPMRAAFAYLGEPVMVLNIASFIMASALVVTGLAKRISLMLVLKWGNHLNGIFWAFIVLNILLGAFISATSAKTALLLPMFMVISAMYGAFGGAIRNNVGRNMVLQNLLANNVSASAFITGSAANLLAAQLLEKAGAKVMYAEWLMALLPLCLLQCAIAWYTGVKWIMPISKEEREPHLTGGMARLRDELDKLGPVTGDEVRAAIIFLSVLGLWATESVHGIRAEVVAVAGCIAVLLPAFSGLKRFGVVDWNHADIPWHMLMFSWGAYVLGGMMEKTTIVDLAVVEFFRAWGISAATPKVVVFLVMATLFGLTTLVSESKTARTIIMFPILIATAKQFGWDVIGFCLPMAYLINQVYVLYFNSKPANISYLTNQYSTWDGFKFGMIQLLLIIALLVPWTHYVMPMMGFNSRLW